MCCGCVFYYSCKSLHQGRKFPFLTWNKWNGSERLQGGALLFISTYSPADTAAAPESVVIERDKNKSRATRGGWERCTLIVAVHRENATSWSACLLYAPRFQECIRGRVYITPGPMLQVRLMAQVLFGLLGMYRSPLSPLLSSQSLKYWLYKWQFWMNEDFYDLFVLNMKQYR